MKRATLCRIFAHALLAAVLLSGAVVRAATSNGPAAKTGTNAATGKATTNAAPVEIPIPASVFIIPKARGEGVDPFFPTTRPQIANTNTSTNKSSERAELVIKGISGTLASPQVIINDRTFRVGDAQEVTTPQGRIHVRCLEIRLKDEAAVLEVNSERRELRFRNSK